MLLSKADHDRVSAAIGAAEARTSGEIFCIVTREVSHYPEIPLAWATAAALALPALGVAAGVRPWELAAAPAWSAATGAGDLRGPLEAYALVQAALFAVVAFLTALPPVRRALTPGALKRRRVRAAAHGHFVSTGLALAEGRTGVLIFASDKDRAVEIVADDAIHRAVGDEAWRAAVAKLVSGVKRGDPADGFVLAVEACGDALAAHFPAAGPHANRFPDAVVEI